ncbi:MAG: hypothetical protein GY701_25255, partial [Sulfitobacter sp.]|nr:hypothetical protein [Sulfitobacter sp.]
AEAQAGTDTVRAVTPAGLASRTATETRAGLIEIATAAEAQALASAVVALTPARLADAFRGANQSLNPNGYQRLPGGLIIQWGRQKAGDVYDDYYGYTVFPIAFPNNTFLVSATLHAFGGEGLDATVAVIGHFLPGFGFTVQECNSVYQNVEVRYIALGY